MISKDYKDMLLALLAENVKFILANKRASGRPKDLLDVQLLVRLITEK